MTRGGCPPCIPCRTPQTGLSHRATARAGFCRVERLSIRPDIHELDREIRVFDVRRQVSETSILPVTSTRS